MACETVNYLKLVDCTFYLAKRDANGKPGPLEDLGEAPMFEYQATLERAEAYNTKGRYKKKAVSFGRQLDVSAKITLKEATLKNLARLGFGDVIEASGDTVTSEPFPRSNCAVGEKDLLPGFPTQVTSVTIVDSAGSPSTLVLNTNYSLDADNGIVTWLNVSGKTQPFKATYTYPDRDIVSLARDAAADDTFWLVVVGENAARSYEKTRMILFNCQLNPGNVPLVDADSNDAAGQYLIDLIVLEDLCREEDDADPFGRFGFQERIA